MSTIEDVSVINGIIERLRAYNLPLVKYYVSIDIGSFEGQEPEIIEEHSALQFSFDDKLKSPIQALSTGGVDFYFEKWEGEKSLYLIRTTLNPKKSDMSKGYIETEIVHSVNNQEENAKEIEKKITQAFKELGYKLKAPSQT